MIKIVFNNNQRSIIVVIKIIRPMYTFLNYNTNTNTG